MPVMIRTLMKSALPGVAALAVWGLAACDSTGTGASPAAPAYVLADTMPYENLVWSGRMAVLKRDGVVIDTVDADFGVYVVGRDSILFLPVRSDSSPEGPVRTIAEPVLYDGRTRTPLRDIVPHFSSQFSSPAVVDGALLYWGLHHTDGIDSVKAVRYEFGRRRLNVLPLTDSITGTDNRFHYTPPHLEGKEIVFESPEGRWAFRVPKASQ